MNKNENYSNLIEFYNRFTDEQACRDYLEKARWGDEITCPQCGVVGEAYKYKDGRLFKCGACRKQFTVRVGTIFEDSKVPLQKWFLAIYLTTSLKKGISSIQLSKYLGITQKTAWFMLHRIRYAVEDGNGGTPLNGSVEVDEAYIGGDGYNRGRKIGRTIADKQVVIGMVERKGRAKLQHIPSSGARALLPQIQRHVELDSTIISDEYGAYKSLPKLGYRHETVYHKLYFGRGAVHTNTIEGLWSHLKRGIDGVYHHVSPKHLQRYCDEFQYRYNTRGFTDGERFNDWFGHILGRITYKELING